MQRLRLSSWQTCCRRSKIVQKKCSLRYQRAFLRQNAGQLVKQLFGSARPLVVLPGCCLGGAAFCLLCDLIARSMFAPTELSISAVTAVFGAPVVIWLLVRRGQEGVR